MRTHWHKTLVPCGLLFVLSCGRLPVVDELTDAVRSRAQSVADRIGGPEGYGGPMMTGFMAHAPSMLGFAWRSDLADEDGVVVVSISNQTQEDATFHLSYLASHMGLSDEREDVAVRAGEEVSIELPCAEIVGMGRLQTPGEPGCTLASGETVPNTFAVPMFFGMDFDCGDVVEFSLEVDADDFDGDGNIEELVLVSGGFVAHAQNGGPMGHHHRGGTMHATAGRPERSGL